MKRPTSKADHRLIASLLAILVVTPGFNGSADTISSETTKMQAVLGYAYDSNKQQFVGGQCITSQNASQNAPTPDFSSGATQSGFSFKNDISQQQLATELGFGLSGHASYGVTSGSLAADYYQQSVSNSFSISSNWVSEYAFPNQILSNPAPNLTGKGVLGNPDRWPKTCGDQFVAQVMYGAKLFFSVRVDFKSEAIKSQFESKFKLSGPSWGVDGTLKQASAVYGQNATVTITAHQVGGDVSKITDLFGSGDASSVAPFIQCQLGNFTSCSETLKKFLAYAGDVQSGFPSQIAPHAVPGPAVLQYITVPYTAINIYPSGFPELLKVATVARGELKDLFDAQFNASLTARRLLNQPSSASRHDLLSAEQTKVDNNLLKILDVEKICYDDSSKCPSAVAKLKPQIIAIDDELLRLPTFGYLCKLSLRSEQTDLQTFMSAVALDLNQKSPSSLADCAALSQQTSVLKSLSLDGTKSAMILNDLSALGSLTQLTELTVRSAHVANVIQLSPLLNLERLDLSDNRIDDLTPLADMTQLRDLNLSSNDIEGLGDIVRLHRVQRLNLNENRITDVVPLQAMKDLFIIDLRGNPVAFDKKQMTDLKAALSPSANIDPTY